MIFPREWTVVLFVLLSSSLVISLDFHSDFLTLQNTTLLSETLKYYTSRDHLAGSQFDYETAVYTKNKLEEYGLNASIEPFQATVSKIPHLRYVHGYDNKTGFQYTASLKEEVFQQDPDDDTTVPTYHAFSPSASVTGELVFANFGQVEDFELLKKNNISVHHKIVIVKYGRIFRGSKVFNAQESGAAGVLIYSDPLINGELKGSAYPNGTFKPNSGVERGSVAFLAHCPGDINNHRFVNVCLASGGDLSQPFYPLPNRSYPLIPSQPLSFNDALPLLSALGGHSSPFLESSTGVTHIGPGPLLVNITISANFERTTLWNVIGRINGEIEVDRHVLIGNHRDAWGRGALDPSTGSATMLEIARGFGVLLSNGWRPRRSLMFCSWDGEEQALLGSTHFGEDNELILKEQAVAYINMDVVVDGLNGSLSVSATPSLLRIIREVASQVRHPYSNQTLSFTNPRLFGSGSDYTVFVHKLGIASVDISFRSQGQGVYHTNYDTFRWFDLFGDARGTPTLVATAQLVGLLALKLSDSILLPFDYDDYAHRLFSEYDVLSSLYSKLSAQDSVEQGGQEYAFMNLKYLNLIPLQYAIERVREASLTLKVEANSLMQESPARLANELSNSVRSHNDRLMLAERRFLTPFGLKEQGRPWYSHVVSAPGLFTGYGADPFASIAQPLRDKFWELANDETQTVTYCVNLVAHFLETGGDTLPPWRRSLIISTVFGVTILLVGVIHLVIHNLSKRARQEVFVLSP